MTTPKVSIIIPIYNTEKYLRRCLDSVISQTFTDWECLLVDDGSKDSSGAICDEYAKKDSRFRVFHKENGGVSSARNMGLDNAHGDWIYFSDADDSLYENCLEVLIYNTKEGIDFVMGGYTIIRDDGSLRVTANTQQNKTITIEDSLAEMYCPSDFPYQGYLWCKLFSKKIIRKNSLQFDVNIQFNEDRLFIVEYLCCCKQKVYYTTDPVYQYVERNSGVMASLKKKYNKTFVTDMDAYVKMLECIKQKIEKPSVIKMAKIGCINSFKSNHIMMMNHGVYDPTAHRHLVSLLYTNGLWAFYYQLAFKQFALYLLMHFAPQIIIRKK